MLRVVLRVELVQVGLRAPHPAAEERPPRALREALDERQARRGVDDVVEGVVRLHPLDEERRVARLALAGLLAQLQGQRPEPALSGIERGEIVAGHSRRRNFGSESLELCPDQERLPQLARRD